MNREIKFKGWCERDSEWRFGFYVTDSSWAHEILTMIDGVGLYASSIDVESLGQFTGLVDSKGVEIYEGDLLKLDEMILPVTFCDGSFQIVGSENQGRSPLIQERAKRFTVVGNIFENPELLEAAQ